MKPTIKINFTDFWEGFDKQANFFYKLLSEKYSIEITERPDFLFYSCYGKEYLNYTCIRIFYASENQRPDFLQCDYALSFDYVHRRNHYRLPLYHLYIDKHGYYKQLLQHISIATATAIWKGKTKFCCMLVTNPNATERIDFFNALSKTKWVDSGGRYLNNIGYAVTDKMEFIKDYKFVLAFENSSFPGYTTEKIMEPMVTNCIPVYWGNPLIEKEFNAASFVNVHRYSNFDEVIQQMIALDEQDEKAIEMIRQEKTAAGATEHRVVLQEVTAFLDNIIHRRNKLPIAKNRLVIVWILVLKMKTKIGNRFFKMLNPSPHA